MTVAYKSADNEPEQPSSPSVKSSEEKGIVVVHETKCKLYVKVLSERKASPVILLF